MTPQDPPDHSLTAGVGRRRLFGAGAALATGAVALGGPAAAADERRPDGGDAAAQRRTSPVTSTLASAPQSGVVYRHLSWLDFQPESGPATRQYGGRGAYSSGSSPYLWATMDIPAGALVREVEWYVYNDSGSTLTALGRLWTAGAGTLFTTLRDTQIPAGTTVAAVRSVVPAASWGPYPSGVKLALGLNTAGPAGSVQVNGARVGLSGGGGHVGLLPQAVRVYDSRRSGGLFRKGQARTVQLPAALVPRGVSGVLLNVTATRGRRSGAVTVYSAAGGRPNGATLAFARGGVAEANAVTVPVSNAGRVVIHASRPVHVRLDLLGTIG